MALAHIPLSTKAKAEKLTRPRIIRIHSAEASLPWDYQASAPWDHTVEPGNTAEMNSRQFRKERYFDHINQKTVTTMLDQGLRQLTRTSNQRQAWLGLLQNYQKGDTVTIKINLNNASYKEDVTTNRLDQSVQMVNALVDSLTSSLNISPGNITVADPSRWIHPRIFKDRCSFPGIHWVDSSSHNLWDPGETIRFSKHQPIRPADKPQFPQKPAFHVARVYTETDHIINVCLLKNHGCGITGAMKNHFGAFPPPFAKYLHDGLGSKSYIADVCNTPSIKNKVRLNICEAIFGNWHNNVWCPRPWKTFAGGTPNSLFLGTDPVAFDSVLLQHIIDEVAVRGDEVEKWVREAVNNHDFLKYAMDSLQLGIHEHKPFTRIDFSQIEAV